MSMREIVTCILFQGLDSVNSGLFLSAKKSGFYEVPLHARKNKSSRGIGHDSRVGGIAFHPEATVGLSDSAACLASGAADGKINLWSLER